MKRLSLILPLITAHWLLLTFASAQIPQLINYQGRLVNGTNLFNGQVAMTLRLYTNATSGFFYFEDSNTVNVVDGLYSTFIGDDPTFPSSLPTALAYPEVYVEVEVNGVKLSPRERVASVAYAMSAYGVRDGGVTTAMLDNQAVTADKIAAGAVTSSAIATASITSNKIDWTTMPGSAETTNFVQKTGDTMTGALTINEGAQQKLTIKSDGFIVAIGNGANGDIGGGVAVGYQADAQDRGVAIGAQAGGTNYGASVGLEANGSVGGAALGYQANGYFIGAGIGYQANAYFQGAAIGYQANGTSQGAALGSYANGSAYGVAIGSWVNGTNFGAAMGYQANGNNHGAAVGHFANGSDHSVAVGDVANGSVTGVAVGAYANGSDHGAAVGYQANGTNFGAAMGYEADGSSTGIAVGAYANGNDRGVAVGYQANGINIGTAVGKNANGSDVGIAVGVEADGSDMGTAVGQAAYGGHFGAAVGFWAHGQAYGAAMGSQANGCTNGVGVGNTANGNNYGVAIGREANGSDHGATIGSFARGDFFGVAIGAEANGYSECVAVGAHANAGAPTHAVALGYAVTNDVSNSTRIRGDLYIDGGGSAINYRTTFGTGGWSTKAFTIDHPLDPQNKVLRHFCLEGPVVQNVYNGTAVLDAKGEATVELPAYFEKINVLPQYSLTAVGAAMPNLHVARKIQGNQFAIGGGAPGGEVCWEIKAQRNDPAAVKDLKNRPVEQLKSELKPGQMAAENQTMNTDATHAP